VDHRTYYISPPRAEAAGGLKMDFLVVNSLRDIGGCLKSIRANGLKCEMEIDTDNNVRFLIIDNKKVPESRIVPFKDTFFDIWQLPSDSDVFMDFSLG